jgi:outer membrane immunogenic protein
MKKLLLGLSLSLLTSGAVAADAVVEDVVVVDEAFTWSGMYVGAAVGYGWSDPEVSFDAVPDAFVEYDIDGFLGGIYAGYNYQMSNNIVVGVEADINYSDIDGDGVAVQGGVVAPGFGGTAQIEWQGSVRGRIGYAFDRLLPYFTAGVAFGEIEHDFFNVPTTATATFSDTFTGWTVGGGLEYAVTDNIIVRGEYRYTDFGSEEYPEVFPFSEPHDFEVETHDVRFGVAYKF